VTGPPASVAESSPLRQAGRGIGRAAALIGSITVVARVVGFGRQLVFAHTVGSHCLGTAYTTANQVPNIIYDIVIGGALTGVIVPVLAGAAAHRSAYQPVVKSRADAARPGADGAGPGADAEAAQIASALLTWAVALLAPASLIIVLIARPLASLLLAGVPHCSQAAAVSVSSRMLAIFAPQILLYGLAVVLYGILQAHRRFTAPALAPIVSSIVVIGAYLAFVPLAGGDRALIGLPLPAELVLSVGTTVGVAALMLTALGPALRLRLRLRPTLRFPDGVARRVRALAVVGGAAFIAQDASLVAVIVLANGHQGGGAVVLYNYGWQMFFVPYAVLAVPIATSAFPLLSATDGEEFDRTAASATRAAMLVSWLGAALLAAAAWPAAQLFVAHPQQVHQLALTFTAFAPGLVGFGLAAALSRVLFASGRNRLAAVSLVGGWVVVTAVDVAAVPLVASRWVVPVLGLGNTIGLTYAGIALLIAVRASRGTAALRGSARAAGAGLAGALAGGAAGALLAARFHVSGFVPNAAVTLLVCACAAAVFGAAALALDGGDLRALAARTTERWSR